MSSQVEQYGDADEVSASPADHARTLLTEVDALLAAAERVRLAVRLGGLDPIQAPALAQVAIRLARAEQTTAAMTAAVLGRLDASGWVTEQTRLHTSTWWRTQTRLSKDTAATTVRTAARLHRHYDATAQAWQCARITSEHAQVIVTGIDSVLRRHAAYARRRATEAGVTLDRAALQEELAEHRTEMQTQLLHAAIADRLTPEQLRATLAVLRELADPDGATDAQMRAACEGKLTLKQVGELFHLDADLTLEQGALLRTLLDHFRTTRHARGGTDNPSTDSAGTDSAEPDVDPVTDEPVVIPNKVKDHQALVDLLEHVASNGLGSGPVTERPHLDVTITMTDLAAGVGTAVLERTGTPVPASTARRVACDCDIAVILVEGIYRNPTTGEVLDPVIAGILIAGTGVIDYGRRHRIVPTRLRRALALRDRGCVFPGCHRPPQHTQAHHVIHWCDRGKTSLDNTVLLCSAHHHAVHEGGWTISPRPGMRPHQPGYWAFHPPKTRTRL